MEKSFRKLALVALVGFASSPSLGAAKRTAIPFHFEPYAWSSVSEGNAGGTTATTVSVPGASWLRLYLQAAQLGSHSYIEMTSLQDGARQRLDARSLAQWRNATAYFNGDSVELRLHVAVEDSGVFVELRRVEVGEWVGDPLQTDSVCGPTDGRVPSAHPAVARLMNAGCTGWIAASGQHVTAGHCAGNFANVLQFNVPLSNPDGTINNPPPEDQYSVDRASMVSSARRIGDDWGVFEVFPNPITGLLPIQAQGAAFAVAQSPGSPTLRVTGHGRDANDPTRSQTQQTHVGPNAGLSGTEIRFVVDTATGSSGSPVIDDALGVVIGHYTAGGCTPGGGFNSGTSTFNTAYWNAVNRPAGVEEFRVNSAGGNYTDVSGKLFAADQAYRPGGFGYLGGKAFNTTHAIRNTADDPLYQTYRSSQQSFEYRFDVSSAGTFDVTLHLMAPEQQPGSFVMDVVAEGVVALDDLDVNAEAGGVYGALIETFAVNVSDGVLNLRFVKVNKGAIVSAIEVVERTIPLDGRRRPLL